MAGHRNEIAFQGFNIEQTFVQYKAVWNIFRNIDVSTLFSVFFADQLGYLYSENYTYFQAGINLGYQIAERWRATLGYSYYQTDSEFSARDYYQNRVRLGITYRF
jgi:opacity protein-like surface antigen